MAMGNDLLHFGCNHRAAVAYTQNSSGPLLNPVTSSLGGIQWARVHMVYIKIRTRN